MKQTQCFSPCHTPRSAHRNKEGLRFSDPPRSARSKINVSCTSGNMHCTSGDIWWVICLDQQEVLCMQITWYGLWERPQRKTFFLIFLFLNFLFLRYMSCTYSLFIRSYRFCYSMFSVVSVGDVNRLIISKSGHVSGTVQPQILSYQPALLMSLMNCLFFYQIKKEHSGLP